MFDKWIDAAKNSSYEDKELFDVWQQILARIALGQIQDPILIDTLKKLTNAEVLELLKIERRSEIIRTRDKRVNHYLVSLTNKQILERIIDPQPLGMVVIFAIFYLSICYTISSYLNREPRYIDSYRELAPFFMWIGGAFLLVMLIAYMLIFKYRFTAYRLTWLGSELLRTPPIKVSELKKDTPQHPQANS